jgi:hypothetical protein
LCGILAGSVKSQVRGSENLSILMHQHELISFATKFGFFGSSNLTLPNPTAIFKYDQYPDHQLLSPVKKAWKMTKLQQKHLREHYRTQYEIPEIHDESLLKIDDHIQVWHRCQWDHVVFHSEEYRRHNTTRLSHLACITESIDRNARFRPGVRPEVMVLQNFYIYIQFFGVHYFRGSPHLLMYSQYINVKEHHGLVEITGLKNRGFQDVTILQHLCAKIEGFGNKEYIIDDHDALQDRLLDVIRRPESR